MSETHVFSKHSTNEYSSFIGHSYIHVTDVLWHKQCNKAHSGLTLLSCDWHKRVRIDYGNSGEWTVNYKISPWNLDMQKTWTALNWQLTEYTFLCPFNHKIAKLKKQHMNDNERLCHTHEGVAHWSFRRKYKVTLFLTTSSWIPWNKRKVSACLITILKQGSTTLRINRHNMSVALIAVYKSKVRVHNIRYTNCIYVEVWTHFPE